MSTKADLEDTEGLRQRNVPVQTVSSEQAHLAVLHLNALEEKTAKSEADRKTFGRTPDGQVFTVPETRDMVSQLLSPSEQKNLSDIILLALHASMLSLLWILPKATRVPILGTLFIFWRLAYNVGIGWLLQKQSKQQTLTRWARKSTLFTNASETRHPRLRAFIKTELEGMVSRDYNFDEAPLEYNTWLVFRRVADLILSCDFTSYVLFAVACAARPVGETVIITTLRWTLALLLIYFSLWVKVDAHRVVKDFAWYWGDVFFLVDQSLTFDGVFEMAPHPMYSIGYTWYAGAAILTASNKVLFVSIFAWLAQCAFLVLVESPHIERTYNPPPPRPQSPDVSNHIPNRPKSAHGDGPSLWQNTTFQKPLETHNTLQLDLYRVADTSTILIQVLFFLLTIVTPKTTFCKVLFIAGAVICRLWFSIGIGYLLNRQSTKKKWTRHFLKHGDSTGEAWRQWKGTYLMSMIMCYASFAAAAWKTYTPPTSWDDGLAILKHTVGLSLVALQIWVATSIYDQLGEFGFFYGDFFWDHSPKLTYDGIYRFLNNPERVLGLAGVWGTVLITNSRAMLCLAMLSFTLTQFQVEYVERPHMIKLYGRHLRQDSGLVRTLKRSLPPPLRQWQGVLDKALGEALDRIEEFLDAAKPQIESKLDNMVKPTKDLLTRYPARSISSVENEMIDLRPECYSLEIEEDVPQQKLGNKDSIVQFEFGSPIKVKWIAPANHAKRDWVGLYSLSSRNTSREVTHVSSQGRWIATNFGEYDDITPEQGLVASDVKTTVKQGDEQEDLVTGEMLFTGDKLWWEQGIFEFRYHHNGKHNVMAISQPFEVQIPRFKEDDLELVDANGLAASSMQNEEIIRRAIEKSLLPVVRNCFDRDTNIAPSSPTESFGALVERDGKYSRRAVYAIQHMFGIEFAPQVVKADGQVSNLAWRILEAEKVLQPYSLSKSRGTSTPLE